MRYPSVEQERLKLLGANPLEIEWVGTSRDGFQIHWLAPEYYITKWRGGKSIGGARGFHSLADARAEATQRMKRGNPRKAKKVATKKGIPLKPYLSGLSGTALMSNPVKRVGFDRSSIDSTIAAAKRLQSDKPLYVFATYLGYTIDRRPPPPGQGYYLVAPTGNVKLMSRNPKAMKTIFIRKLKKSEMHDPSATKHMSKIPSKKGFDKVYMPYGKDGRGYYYIKTKVK